MKIYLDVCCLSRPFDDQTQDRIHLESEAVIIIFKHVRSGDWEWVSSEVVEYETGRIPELSRREKVGSLLQYASDCVHLDKDILRRGEVIGKIGFGAYDALHLACAESGHADVFLTTDDQLLKVAKEKASLAVRVENPLTWVKGELWDEC